MTKRESGWYKVKFTYHCDYEVALYDEQSDSFDRAGFGGEYPRCDMFNVCEMVMKPSGQIVCNKPVKHNDVSRSIFVMRSIGSMEPSDIIDGDIGLVFEVDDVDTGCDVSIMDECAIAANLLEMLSSSSWAQDHDPLYNTKQDW